MSPRVPHEAAPSPCGPSPTITVRALAGGASSGGAYAVLVVDAAAGAGAAAHLHEREDLVVILVGGALQVACGGAVRDLAPGEAVHLPRGVPHRTVAGPAGARYICVCVPAGLEDLLAALDDPEPTDDDRAAMLAAAGVRVIPGCP